MKRFYITGLLMFLSVAVFSQNRLDDYLKTYDYSSRKAMKVSNEELAALLTADKAILLDIRFKEEQQSWYMPFAVLMPLNQLPFLYASLDKSKLIVTACPHNDRAIIAMIYLKTKGYEVKYLSEGLLGLADYLRGDKANDFIQKNK